MSSATSGGDNSKFRIGQPSNHINFTVDGNRTMTIMPDGRIEFHADGKLIGRLNWTTGDMQFEGLPNASAKLFAQCLAHYIRQVTKPHLMERLERFLATGELALENDANLEKEFKPFWKQS